MIEALTTVLKLAIPALLFAMGLHASFKQSLFPWARPALPMALPAKAKP